MYKKKTNTTTTTITIMCKCKAKYNLSKQLLNVRYKRLLYVKKIIYLTYTCVSSHTHTLTFYMLFVYDTKIYILRWWGRMHQLIGGYYTSGDFFKVHPCIYIFFFYSLNYFRFVTFKRYKIRKYFCCDICVILKFCI